MAPLNFEATEFCKENECDISHKLTWWGGPFVDVTTIPALSLFPNVDKFFLELNSKGLFLKLEKENEKSFLSSRFT